MIDDSRLRFYKIGRESRGETSSFLVAKPITVQVVLLEVLDDFDQVSYTFDGVTGLLDLYESASFSASRAVFG